MKLEGFKASSFVEVRSVRGEDYTTGGVDDDAFTETILPCLDGFLYISSLGADAGNKDG